MTGTVEVVGLRELERKLQALGDLPAIRRAGREALRAGGRPMLDAVIAGAPDDPATGPGKYLKQSIKMATGRAQRSAGGEQVWVVIGIDVNVDPPQVVRRKRGSGSYRDPGVAGVGPMIEFGTAEMAAQPFFRPAWDEHKSGTTLLVGRALGPAIEVQAQRLAARSPSTGSG